MRVLFVASEMAPFAKTGGLGDVLGALPEALLGSGIDLRVLIPLYQRPPLPELRHVAELFPPFTDRPASLWTLPERPWLWFLHEPGFYQRAGGPYQSPQGQDWPDNPARFAYLSRVAVEIAQGRVVGQRWRPDLVHCHDWQTGLIPWLLELESRIGVPRPATLMTVHNLAYQGRFDPAVQDLLHLPRSDFHPNGTELYGSFSFLKAGLVWADRITTVSQRYASEIQTPEHGMGLDGLLRARASVTRGILNGIDVSHWNPGADPYLPAHYRPGAMEGKARCKEQLQRRLGLQSDPDSFLLGMISRMVEQKGGDLVLHLAPELLQRRIQLVILGSGDPGLEGWAQELAAQHPGRMASVIAFDEGLSHQIEAGIDAFLMPSRFEPCGLNQMYSLRYGSPPIAHETGGLADTVRDVSHANGNGFTFQPASTEALRATIHRAEDLFRQPERWARIVSTGMAEDWGWTRTAQAYQQLYKELRPGA